MIKQKLFLHICKMFNNLPVEIFGHRFYSFEELLKLFNNIWIIQITICFCYCIRTKRYFPAFNLKINIFIKQLYVYFIVKSIIYGLQILFTDTFYFRLEIFLHHLLAISLFIFTYCNPLIISVCYLFPFLVHSIYWCYSGSYSDELLIIYNFTLLICPILISLKTYNRRVKIASIKILISAILLFNVNIVGHFYNYNIQIFKLNTDKLFKSIVMSLMFSVPFYFYLFYLNF
jgi:hypothetical protein